MKLLSRLTPALLPMLWVGLVVVPLAYGQEISAPVKITFTTIDVPGAGVTSVQGINTSGDMVGLYAPMNRGPAYAFLLSGGAFSYFDYPGAYSTEAYGINDSGLIVGFAYFNGGTTAQGLTYDGTTFTLFDDGTNSATFGMGINNAGQFVGGAGSIYSTAGFERKNGHYKSLSPPGNYIYVYATAINDLGEIVGWTDSNAFAYSNGKFLTVAVPGAFETEAHGLNDNGVIVGWYEALQACTCAFALRNGKYVSFGYPGAEGTFAYGINDAGQVVGSYTFDNTTYHGFVTSPITAADFLGTPRKM